MTAADQRTPAQKIEAARDLKRRPLERLLDWLDGTMRPDFVTDADITATVARHVGHPVDEAEVRGALDAIMARDRYLNTPAPLFDGAELRRREGAADEALDALLDLFDCADCAGLHPADEVRSCDHGTFGVGTYPDCYTAFHGQNFCPSVDER